MTNGITVQPDDECSVYFDYWLNETCSSGFSHGVGGSVLSWLFVQLNENRHLWEPRLYNKYKDVQTLAVPEQLVWWGEDDQEV